MHRHSFNPDTLIHSSKEHQSIHLDVGIRLDCIMSESLIHSSWNLSEQRIIYLKGNAIQEVENVSSSQIKLGWIKEIPFCFHMKTHTKHQNKQRIR